MSRTTAVLGVVYPGAMEFLDDFLDSWSAQGESDFTLCLVNDGVDDLDRHLAGRGLSVRVGRSSGTPAALRSWGIGWCLEQGFEIIILGDCDDTFDPDRVAVARRWLGRGYDIVANELQVFGPGNRAPRPWLGPRLGDGREITLADITHGNMLGLSNCAVRAAALDGEHEDIPPHLPAFDWPWFSALLAGGARAVFTDQCATGYRQHPGNLVGRAGLEPAAVIKAVEVKAATYDYLATLGRDYVNLAACFGGLRQRLRQDDSFQQRYLAQVRRQADPDGFWWECAVASEELKPCR